MRPVAIVVNSRLTHTFGSTFAIAPTLIGAPGVPNRCGSTTVYPAATSSSANPITCGVRPGISWITTTPGPVPLRYVGWLTLSAVCSSCVQLSRRLIPAA